MKNHPRSSIPRSLALAGVVLPVCILAFGSPAGAQTAARKFGRGLAGMAAGVLELPGNTVAETEKQGAAAGVPIGVAKGLGMIVARELVGVYEVVSAPFPIPPGFRPPLSPEFPWGYFEGTQPTVGSRRRSPSEQG
jgi:putative exosortase-associated protein (TIGR04073 family)